MDSLIKKLAHEPQSPSAGQLNQIARYVAAAPFAEDLLVVDEPLWGGFWQGDVIAPGYQLPAVELALLRAVRLDKNWPEDTTLAQFLAHLHQAILDPQAGIWPLTVADQPCVMFTAASGRSSAVSGQSSTTVVWYCATTGRLHAGYRAQRDGQVLATAVEQRLVGTAGRQNRPVPLGEPPAWLAEVIKQREAAEMNTLAARLDTAILRWRYGR